MKTVTIFCVEQLENGTSFGITEDTGESVFVPSTVAKRVNLQIGDSAVAKIVANVKLPEKTPWFAVKISTVSSEETAAPVKDADLKTRVRNVIYSSKTYFTSEDVCEELETAITQKDLVETALYELLNNREVCRAKIEVQPGSFADPTLWASSVECFLGDSE